MRTIKFRGKSLKDGEFEYGSLLTYQKSIDIEGDDHVFAAITYEGLEPIDVEPNTVGQFTGLFDKNGKEIYEGDIITCINKSDSVYEIGRQMIGFVAYEENGCYWFCKNNFQHYNDWAFADDIEVIGNVHDNFNLL